jgi:hypothetical protein
MASGSRPSRSTSGVPWPPRPTASTTSSSLVEVRPPCCCLWCRPMGEEVGQPVRAYRRRCRRPTRPLGRSAYIEVAMARVPFKHSASKTDPDLIPLPICQDREATLPPSRRRSSASRRCASTPVVRPAAPASTSAASRRRPCTSLPLAPVDNSRPPERLTASLLACVTASTRRTSTTRPRPPLPRRASSLTASRSTSSRCSLTRTRPSTA